MLGLSKLNWPCGPLLARATSCIPPIGWAKVSSTPAASCPVVPFRTVPCTVPACAAENGTRSRKRSSNRAPGVACCWPLAGPELRGGKRLLRASRGHWPLVFIARSGQRDVRFLAAEPALPLLDRFPKALALLHFPERSSWPQNRLPNIFPTGIQTANPANCHKWCPAAPATDPAWCGAAQGPTHPAEYKK